MHVCADCSVIITEQPVFCFVCGIVPYCSKSHMDNDYKQERHNCHYMYTSMQAIRTELQLPMSSIFFSDIQQLLHIITKVSDNHIDNVRIMILALFPVPMQTIVRTLFDLNNGHLAVLQYYRWVFKLDSK